MPARRLSEDVLRLTSKYLPDSKGFSAHACRHLVATEYIKNFPDGWEVAAAALHNTVEVVRRHYSWVEDEDLIKPWSEYHEQLKKSYDRGDL
jgi:integrase